MNVSHMMTNVTANSTTNLSHVVIPEGCFVLQLQAYIPWDNPQNLISASVTLLVSRLKSFYVLPALVLVGCSTNCINMVVFYKQGLRERINLCLFALSFADLVFMVSTMMMYVERFVSQFTGADLRLLGAQQLQIVPRFYTVLPWWQSWRWCLGWGSNMAISKL
nr:hypothetical protein BaRGS_001871 [Batillaria attramentaria]